MRSRVEWQLEANNAWAQAASAGAFYGQAVQSLNSAREEESAARSEVASARSKVDSARGEEDGSEVYLTAARRRLAEAERRLDEAEQRRAEAENDLREAESKVEAARARLERAFSSAREALEKADGVHIDDGAVRFAGHFKGVRDAWELEKEFFQSIVAQIEGAMASLAHSVTLAKSGACGPGSRRTLGSGDGWPSQHGLPGL